MKKKQLTREDFGFLLIFPATIAVFSAHLLEGLKTLRSLRKEKANPEILTN